MSATVRGRKFEPPGPGAWELDQAHFTRPFTAFAQEILPEPFMRGFREGTRRYGLLLDTMEPGLVHGFAYMRPRPVGAPPSATRPPPKLLFKLLVLLHPEIRRRLSTCRNVFETKLWREDLRRWDDEIKPASIRKHRALQDTDPRSLDESSLAQHLVTCRDHLADMICQHHQFTIPCIFPTGDYLAHARDWTGLSVGKLLEPLRGSSPVSKGVAAEELVELARAVALDDNARQLVESDQSAAAILAQLRETTGPTGQSARRYLDVVSHRILGYDVADHAAIDVPEVLVKAIRIMLHPAAEHGGEEKQAQAIAAVRDKVPDRHRDQFDNLLSEARFINRLRDERGVYSDAWATGLTRRAILAAGERVAEAGRLANRELLLDATLNEMLKLLRGDGGPDSSELRERAIWRTTAKPEDAPPWLGAPPSAPPPAEWLPAHGARAARAMDAALGGLFKDCESASDARVIRGLPVSGGVYEGPARIITSSEEFGRLQQGDVLVTRTTSAYFNAVLPLLGAIVTERGGQLSHAAIVAREYGIPGVVGTKVATTTIGDGARVRVDGDAGEVILL